MMDSPNNPFAESFDETVDGKHGTVDGDGNDGNGGGNNSGGIFDPFADLFPVMPQNVPPPLPSVPQQQQQQQQQQEDLQLQSLEVSPPPLTPFDVNKNVSTAQDYNGETTISASPQQAQDESDTTASVPISISSPQNIEHSNPFSMQQTVSAGNIGSGKPQLGTSRNDDKNEHENAVESNSDGFAGLHPNESMPMEQQHHELPEHQQQLELPIGQPALSLQPKDNLMQQEQPQPSNENENAGENGLFSSVLLGSSTKTGDNPFSATIPTDTSSTGVASTSTTPDETSADTDGGLFNESVHNNEMKETTEQKVPIVQDEVETSYNRENSGDRRIDYTPYGAFADGELESDDIDNTTVANSMGTSTMGQSNKNPFDEAMNNYGEGDSNEGALALSANDRSLNNIASHNGSYNSNTNSIEDSSQRLAAMRSNHSSSFTTYTEGESWKSDDDDNSSSSRSSSDVEECQEIMKTDEEFLLRRSKGDDFNASSRGRSLTPRKSIHIDDSTDDEGDDDGATSSRSNESEEVETRLRYASVAAAKRGSYPEEEEEDKQVEQVDQRVAAGGDDSGSDTTSSRGVQSSEGSFFTKRFKGGVEEDDLVSVTFGREQSHDADKNLKDDKDSPIKPGFNSDSAARHSTMSQEELDTFLHPLMDFEDDYSDTRLRDAASDGMVNGISTGNDEESAFTGAPSVQAPQQSQHGQQNNKTSSSPKRKKKRKDDSQKAFYIIMIVSITAVALCLGAFIYFWFLPYLDKLEAKKKANNNMWQPPSMSPPKSPDAQVIATPILNESAPCAYFTMSLLTDAYGNETTWELHYYGDAVVGNNTTGSRVAFDSRAVHDSDASLSMSYFAPKVDSKRIRRHIHKQRKSQEIREPAIIATGGPYDYVDTKSPSYDPETSGRHIASMCLPEGSYKFLLKDVNGDGICCDYGLGSYGLYFNGGRDVRPTSLAEFFVKEETLFQVTEEDVVLANTSTSPSVSLAPTSTDYPSSIPSTTPTYIPDSLLSMQTVRSINTLSGISKSHGLLFDIETNSNISSLNVVSMELLIDSQGPIEYEIWTMKGSRHELDLTDPNFFTAFYKVSEGILNASGVCETCGFSSIPLDQFQDVLIEGWRTRQAFWISLKQNTLVFQEYEDQKESHNLQVISQVATPEFEIYYGTAVLFEPINMVNPKLDFRGVMGFLGKIWYQANFMNESSVNASSPSTPAYENNATTLNSNSSSNFPETNPSNSSIPTEVYSGDSSINDTLPYQSNVTNGTQPSNFSSHTPESDQSNSSLPTDIITGAYTPIPTSFPTLNPTLTPHLNGSSVPNILPSLSPNISSELNASSISHDNSANDSVPPQGTTQLMTDLSYPYIFSSTFQGNLAPSRFGSSVAISKDGKILAIGAMGAINGLGTPSGAVYIYEIDSDGVNGTSQTWLQTIFGESSGEEFGCAVSISQFGNEIVVGSRSEMGLTGAMRVFRRTNNTWAIQGDPIFGFSEGGQAGWSVAISGDGQIVAMGIPKGGANGGGSVTAFKFGIDEINYDMAWIPYGNPVEGLVNGEETGYSIALSQDGGILAVGSPKTSSPLGIMFAGKVSVNRYNGSDWVVVGQEMFGESPDDNHGTSVALSQDGAVLLVGSKGKDVNGTENVGQCSLYDLTESSFGSSTYSLLGESPEEHLGSFVALSSDASIVACGGVNGNFDGSSISGVVRVFNRNTQQESTVWPKTDVLSSWDAALFGSSIAVPSTGHYLVIGAPGWSDGSEGSTNGSLQIFEDSA